MGQEKAPDLGTGASKTRASGGTGGSWSRCLTPNCYWWVARRRGDNARSGLRFGSHISRLSAVPVSSGATSADQAAGSRPAISKSALVMIGAQAPNCRDRARSSAHSHCSRDAWRRAGIATTESTMRNRSWLSHSKPSASSNLSSGAALALQIGQITSSATGQLSTCQIACSVYLKPRLPPWWRLAGVRWPSA